MQLIALYMALYNTFAPITFLKLMLI